VAWCFERGPKEGLGDHPHAQGSAFTSVPGISLLRLPENMYAKGFKKGCSEKFNTIGGYNKYYGQSKRYN